MACHAAFQTARAELSVLERKATMIKWRIEDIGVVNYGSTDVYERMFEHDIVYPVFTMSPSSSPAPSAELAETEPEASD
jgi:hypothetical protein